MPKSVAIEIKGVAELVSAINGNFIKCGAKDNCRRLQNPCLVNPKVPERTYTDKMQLIAIHLNVIFILDYTNACVIRVPGRTNFF